MPSEDRAIAMAAEESLRPIIAAITRMIEAAYAPNDWRTQLQAERKMKNKRRAERNEDLALNKQLRTLPEIADATTFQFDVRSALAELANNSRLQQAIGVGWAKRAREANWILNLMHHDDGEKWEPGHAGRISQLAPQLLLHFCGVSPAVAEPERTAAPWDDRPTGSVTQARAQFSHSRSGREEHRQNFEYDVTIADLLHASRIALVSPPIDLKPDAFFRLSTRIRYSLHISDPEEIFYVGVLFPCDALPRWSAKSNFYLRELVELPDDDLERLSEAYREMPASLPVAVHHLPPEGSGDDPRIDTWRARFPHLLDAANDLASLSVRVEGTELAAELFYVDREGVCWGFVPPAEVRAAKQSSRGAHVEIALDTLMSRHRSGFPAVIVAETHNPTIRFDYSKASIEDVFVRLGTVREHQVERNQRIYIRTDDDYWAPQYKTWEFTWREKRPSPLRTDVDDLPIGREEPDPTPYPPSELISEPTDRSPGGENMDGRHDDDASADAGVIAPEGVAVDDLPVGREEPDPIPYLPSELISEPTDRSPGALMAERPEVDIAAPLSPLRPGELPSGLWVEPMYYACGYAGALPIIWLRAQVLTRLLAALHAAQQHGYGLLVWDGWRPRELQRTLWNEYRKELAQTSGLRDAALDERARAFVSHPDADGTPAHLTGGAVDLTLCDGSGRPLNMGGGFDELTNRSHPDFYEHRDLTPAEVEYRDRRRILLSALTTAGFWRLPTEWWHFEWGTSSWASAVSITACLGEASAPLCHGS